VIQRERTSSKHTIVENSESRPDSGGRCPVGLVSRRKHGEGKGNEGVRGSICSEGKTTG